MRVFITDEHASHAPKSFIIRGQRAECPERPEREEILRAAVTQAGHEIHQAGAFGLAPIQAVHDADYLDFLRDAWSMWQQLPNHAPEVIPNVHPNRNMAGAPGNVVALAGYYQADTSCPIGPGTWEGAVASAQVAVTGARTALDDMAAGETTPFAYALCRPPGHHAYADQAGGFCFLNNSAIAAQYCRNNGAARVAILDVDVHHGNGTQGIFYERDDVLTVSLHGDPTVYYPMFAGHADEVGAGVGEGFNLNLPQPRDTGDDAYLKALATALARIEHFAPDVLIIALGLDASEADPLAFMSITTDGFRRMAAAISGSAQRPTLLVQEGGYISDVLGDNLAAFLDGFETAR